MTYRNRMIMRLGAWLCTMIQKQLEVGMVYLCPKHIPFLFPSYVSVSGRKFECDVSIPREMVVRSTLHSLALSHFKPCAPFFRPRHHLKQACLRCQRYFAYFSVNYEIFLS